MSSPSLGEADWQAEVSAACHVSYWAWRSAQALRHIPEQLLTSFSGHEWLLLPSEACESGGGRRCAVEGGGSGGDLQLALPRLKIHGGGTMMITTASRSCYGDVTELVEVVVGTAMA
jgi:hypothetical protein